MSRRGGKGSGGFSLIELMITCVLTGVVTLAVHSLVSIGHQSTTFVSNESKHIRGMRDSGNDLARDLRQTTPSKLTITTLKDGNHEVTLQSPLSLSSGQIIWGVYDASLGTTDASRTRPGWSIRYTIVSVPRDGGGIDRQLRRQIIDDKKTIVRQTTVMHYLKTGTGNDPGFKLTLSGSMYHVAINAYPDPREGQVRVRDLGFDVAIRN